MQYKIIGQNKNIMKVEGNDLIIKDVQSALDLMVTASYEAGCSKIILNKSTICEDFFVLSTRIAGEILQKFINYQVQLAIVGDYSVYTSKPLKDFIYESNKGNHFFFVGTLDEAILKLDKPV